MQREHHRQVLSSREFNQDVGRAKRAASEGPVVITDRGRPAYVLLRYDEYRRIMEKAPRKNLFDLIGQDGPEHDFDFDPPKLDIRLRVPDFD